MLTGQGGTSFYIHTEFRTYGNHFAIPAAVFVSEMSQRYLISYSNFTGTVLLFRIFTLGR